MVKHLPTMQETWVQSLGREDLLEKEMATHSSILAWKIPWMEKPGRLQFMGSQEPDVTSLSLSLSFMDDKRVSLRPSGSVVKNLPASTGDQGSIPGLERSPGEGNGNSLQYSCLENPMDREAWRATAHGVTKVSDMT